MSQLDNIDIQNFTNNDHQAQGLNPRNYHQQQNNEQNNFENDQEAQGEQGRDFKEVLIKISDLQPQDECAVISIANAAIEQIADMTNVFETQKYSKIAGVIKRELDQKLGQGWYVIVGKNFGTYVTHEKGSFMHFTFEDLHICIFRAR